MPDVDAMFAKLSGHSQSTIVSFCSSFDRYIKTPLGLFQFTKMPFWVGHSTSNLLSSYAWDVAKCFQYHRWYFGIYWHFSSTFLCAFWCLTASPISKFHSKTNKAFIGVSKLEYLGHSVGDDKIHHHPDKVLAIQQANHPTSYTIVPGWLCVKVEHMNSSFGCI